MESGGVWCVEKGLVIFWRLYEIILVRRMPTKRPTTKIMAKGIIFESAEPLAAFV